MENASDFVIDIGHKLLLQLVYIRLARVLLDSNDTDFRSQAR